MRDPVGFRRVASVRPRASVASQSGTATPIERTTNPL
jgi:hypothetical protein